MTGLPNGWRLVALNDAAEIVMGQSPPSSAYNENNIGMPFFQGKAEFGERYPIVKKWTTAGTKQALAGDILMSVRAPVGPTNIANVDCVIGRGLAAIRAGSHTNQTFLLWVLRSLESEIASKGVGTTFTAISGGELRRTQLPLPPLAEQERIVDVLEEQFSRLDSALASIRVVREKAAAFRRSLLHAAFRGDLTGGTAGWRQVTLKDAAEVVMGQSPPSSAYNQSGIGMPFFQGKAEFGDRYPTVKKWTTTGSKQALAGDILMSVRAPVGPTNLANVDCVIGRGLAAIRAGSLTNQTFLLWVLRSLESEIASKGVGTTFTAISGGELRSTQLPLPPLAEQERVVEILEEQFSRLDNVLEVASQLEARIASERRALLHAAFTGGLTAKWRRSHV